MFPKTRRWIAATLVAAGWLGGFWEAGGAAFGESFRDWVSVGFRPAWSVRVYVNNAFAYKPREFGQCGVAEDGAIVVCGARTGEVLAIAQESGRVLWSFRTRGEVRARPWVGADGVFVGSADGCVYRLEAVRGRPLWEKPFCTDGPVEGGIEVEGGVVFFSLGLNKVYAVGAERGEFLWEYHRDRPEMMSIEGVSGPSVSEGKVYVGFSDGTLSALEAQSGAVVWSIGLADKGATARDIDATPIVDGGLVFTAAFARGPAVVDGQSGAVRWRGRWMGATRPVLKGDLVVFGTADGEVVGVRRDDGGVVFRSLVSMDGAVYGLTTVGDWIVAGFEGGLMVLDASDGFPLERLLVPLGVYGDLGTCGSRLFFVGSGGTITAVDVLVQ